MPKKRKKEKVCARHYSWLIGRRGGVWYADGRSNPKDMGRHSLGTRDHDEAKERVFELDLSIAIRNGLAVPADIHIDKPDRLKLEEGSRLYLEYVSRARVTGGVRPSSHKRYRAVFDKFVPFAQGRGLVDWNEVKGATLEGYSKHLEKKDYAYRTLYLELTTIKQAISWFVATGRLPSECQFSLPLRKAQGTDTYCWTAEEVRAMVQHCQQIEDLNWLGNVIIALASTGLRISELAQLRWTDIDLNDGMIRLPDETTRSGGAATTRRSTKGGRSRVFPIHELLATVLKNTDRNADGFVFHGPKGGRIKPDTVRNILIKDVLESLGNQFKTVEGDRGFCSGRLHSFRHYFCSVCANSGVPQQVVMRWLGHRDSRMVEHYYHLHDEEARRQMSRLDVLGNAAGNGAGGEKLE